MDEGIGNLYYVQKERNLPQTRIQTSTRKYSVPTALPPTELIPVHHLTTTSQLLPQQHIHLAENPPHPLPHHAEVFVSSLSFPQLIR